jgi:Protein of unknown function (DUF2804)
MHDGLPYRGRFGDPRPPALSTLPLPPAPMPARDRLRPLKCWRYVGVYGPELMLCAASIRIGPARQAFWAVWDRRSQRLHERTASGRGAVRLGYGSLRVIGDRGVTIELELDEGAGVETVCPSGQSYAWTRKQGGVSARGTVALDGVTHRIDGRAVIDDTAGYYERHTSWRWSAGVGESTDGRALAWNLVEGVNDPPSASERTVWVEGEPRELDPLEFADDLGAVGGLSFTAEAVRESRQNLGLVRSAYRQPFGTFSGRVGGVELTHGYGVMEEHDVRW